MKYLIYARVSPKGSKWDSCETSVPVQIEECKAYVTAIDKNAEFFVLYDEQFSGKDLNRPSVKKLLTEIKTNKWDCLVVWHLDRLSRSISDAIPLFKELQNYGKSFISVRQNIDFHSAGGRFALHIFTAAAQYEREMCSERVKLKMEAMLEKGLYVGNVPFGYKKDPKDKYKIIPDSPKCEYVKEIFKLYSEDRLTIEKIKSFGMLKQTAYDVLDRIIYTGKVKFGDKIYEGRHEPLVSMELFNLCQEKKNKISQECQTRPTAQTYKYKLAGIIRCHCGYAMTPYSVKKKNNQRYHYYKCKNCNLAVSAKKVDDFIIRDLTLKMQTSSIVEETISSHFARFSVGEEIQEELRQNEELIKKTTEYRDSIMKMFFEGLVNMGNKDYVNDELYNANQTIAKLTEENKMLIRKQELRMQAIKNAVNMRNLVRDYFKSINPESVEEVKKLVKCVERIVVRDKDHFEVVIAPGIISDEKGVMTNSEEWWCIHDLFITVCLAS